MMRLGRLARALALDCDELVGVVVVDGMIGRDGRWRSEIAVDRLVMADYGK